MRKKRSTKQADAYKTTSLAEFGELIRQAKSLHMSFSKYTAALKAGKTYEKLLAEYEAGLNKGR